MKAFLTSILFLWGLATQSVMAGGLPVVDITAIASQRLAAQRDLLEQILQETNQQTQIAKTLEQISQIDSYLKKFGDPERVKDLAGLDELLQQLEAPPGIETPLPKPEDPDAQEVFRSFDSKLTPKLEKDIIVDGKVEAERDSGIYLPEVAERRAHADYQKVRASVMARRIQLRQAIAANMSQLKQATTASEVQKASAVLVGLQTELQAIDHELEFASDEVAARALANATEQAIQQKAAVEQERAKLRAETRKEAAAFQLFTAPVYFGIQP